MTQITISDLQPWVDPDDVLEALYELAEQTRGQAVPSELISAVTTLLDHEDEDIRQEALRLLLVQWKDRSQRDRGIALLRLDPSEAVRGTAAFGLASLSTVETRHDDARTLLSVLLDEAQPVHVRGAAYDALLIIHRRKEFPPMTRDLDLTVDIDWEWIKRLRTEG